MLNVAKPIVDSVNIPVWVDVDTGYGNFLRTVREFEKIGVAGICVEDNLPALKQNSLWGDKIPLMSMEDFGKKLNSVAWDERGIQIIARTEALIRGYGAGEAIKRLQHYVECGADIIMPHARKLEDVINAKENFSGWPVAIVPTKFPEVTNLKLFDMGYNMTIWANQTERAKIKAVRDCLGSLHGSDCAEYIEANLSATLDDMKGLMPDE
jgi:phosphoenolpyruvate phosphomutase